MPLTKVTLNDIVTDTLPVANGGTGANSAATARSNLGTNDATNITTGTLNAARLPTTGVNAASITSGTLAVANGGTGLTSPGSSGNVLTSNGTAWVSAPGTNKGQAIILGMVFG